MTGDGQNEACCPGQVSSSPLLLKLARRREMSRGGNRNFSSPLFAVSSVLAIVAAVFFTSASAQLQATVSPLQPFCPVGCICFYTLMYCQGISEIPSSIQPATKFVHISQSVNNFQLNLLKFKFWKLEFWNLEFPKSSHWHSKFQFWLWKCWRYLNSIYKRSKYWRQSFRQFTPSPLHL